MLNAGKEPDDLLLGAFWHEYAHHIFFTSSVATRPAWHLFLSMVLQTSAYQEALLRDTEEENRYWALEEELWARAAGQFFLALTEPPREYAYILRLLKSEEVIQWQEEEFGILRPCILAVLHEIGWSFLDDIA